jgi:hypothetical protein
MQVLFGLILAWIELKVVAKEFEKQVGGGESKLGTRQVNIHLAIHDDLIR